MPARLRLASAIALALLPAFAFADDAGTPAKPDESLVRLDRINVFGSPSDVQTTAGSAHYLGDEELEKFNYRDVHRVLRQVPGVYLVEEEGYGLRPNIGIRGSGTDRNARITVMEDGVLIAPAPYAAPAAYYFPTMARINAVEILKGSASVIAGPRTTGGAVNLVTTPIPTETAGELDVSVGSDATVLAHGWVGTMGERFGALVEGVRQQTDGFKQLDGGGDTGYRLDDAMAKLRWVSAPDAARFQQLDLKISHTTQDSDETYLGLADADFDATPYRRYAASALDNIQTTHDLVELRHTIELSDRADLTTVAYRTEFKRNWFKLNDVQGTSLSAILANPTLYASQYAWLTGAADSPVNALRLRNNNRAYVARGVQSVLGLELGAHALEVGVRLHEDEEDRYQNDDRFQMLGGRLVLTTDGAPGTQENRVGAAEAVSLYVQDSITMGDWILTPGLRYERIDLTRTNYSTVTGDRDVVLSVNEARVEEWIPGVGLAWNAADDLTVFASVHKGFNPPGPGSTAESEESVNSEIGLRWSAGATRAELVAFHVGYSNLVGTCTASTGGNCTIGDQYDGGKARVMGLEASLGHVFDLGGDWAMPVSLAYTYTDAEFRSSFVSSFEEWQTVESGDQLPYLPEHTVHGELGLEGGAWRFTLGANYVDSMRSVAGSGAIPPGERTDAALVWDLSAAWEFAEGAELYGRVENLADETYVVARRPAGARPGLPRSVFMGVRWAF